MATQSPNDARLNFRLPAEIKETIEQAAVSGKTVSDFAISTLSDTAQTVLEEHDRTVLSRRDRDRFVKLPVDKKLGPNEALRKATGNYKKRTT